MNTYITNKLKYNSLYCSIGGGNPPFRFLVIGGSDRYSYGDGFYEVGSHRSSNYGIGLDWKTHDFWDNLIQELVANKYYFDVCFFDANFFLQFTNPAMFEKILDIFSMFLKENGCIILNAYNITNPNENNIERQFHNFVLETATIQPAEPCEFMFSGNNSGNVFRIFQKVGSELKIKTDNIYFIDYDKKFMMTPNVQTLQKPIEEKTMQEFLVTRFGKKDCPICSFSNDEENTNCVICGQNIVTHSERKQPTQVMHTRPESVQPVQVMSTHLERKRPVQAMPTYLESKQPSQAIPAQRPTRTMTVHPESVQHTRPESVRPAHAITVRPEGKQPARARNGAAFTACVDLSDPINPRVLVCLLYVISDVKCIENIKTLYDNKQTNFSDIISELKNIEETRPILEHIDKKMELRKVTTNEKYMANQNMRLIRYGGGLDIMETQLLMEYEFKQRPPAHLEAKIIEQSNIVLDTKIRPSTNMALSAQPQKHNVKWDRATFEYTINISSPNGIIDYASLMFNYWISSVKSKEDAYFKSDLKFPLIGVFNACGCIKELQPDRFVPTRNALFGRMTPVDHHIHLEGEGFYANYNIGSDMAKIGILC